MKKGEKSDLKTRLVEEASEMIQELGYENIRVRDLAKRVECTAPALYKHFENMDYLLGVASLKYLRPYIEELRENLMKNSDIIEAELEAWRLFNKYAFRYPGLFLNLFWSGKEDFLESILQEYFEMYPLEVRGKDIALFYTSIFSGSVEQRDYVWFRRAAAEGLLNYDDAKYVSEINCLIARGLLHKHMYDYRDEQIYKEAVEKCNDLIEKNIRMYLIKS